MTANCCPLVLLLSASNCRTLVDVIASAHNVPSTLATSVAWTHHSDYLTSESSNFWNALSVYYFSAHHLPRPLFLLSLHKGSNLPTSLSLAQIPSPRPGGHFSTCQGSGMEAMTEQTKTHLSWLTSVMPQRKSRLWFRPGFSSMSTPQRNSGIVPGGENFQDEQDILSQSIGFTHEVRWRQKIIWAKIVKTLFLH